MLRGVQLSFPLLSWHKTVLKSNILCQLAIFTIFPQREVLHLWLLSRLLLQESCTAVGNKKNGS